MKKLLWVEEEADSSMVEFFILFESVEYFDLTIAKTATEAKYYLDLDKAKYDLIIMDIRIPPGSDNFWENEYLKGERSLPKERLGIAVISDYFSNNVNEEEKSRWMIFTIEPFWTVKNALEDLSLNWFEEGKNYFEKINYRFPEDFLIEIERKIQ